MSTSFFNALPVSIQNQLPLIHFVLDEFQEKFKLTLSFDYELVLMRNRFIFDDDLFNYTQSLIIAYYEYHSDMNLLDKICVLGEDVETEYLENSLELGEEFILKYLTKIRNRLEVLACHSK